jgi:23S rRNA (cytidine1920-2'-O)/16S rRNA (cytidine1409-2'-O)-methyltransferase
MTPYNLPNADSATPGEASATERLDRVLVDRGLYDTRSRARDAIVRGTVTVNGAVVRKPGHPTAAADALSIADDASAYVSRAALKLVAGLDAFNLDPTGRTALDIGASTGGFTQVLLERGAAHVVAVDVGHGQLHPSLEAHHAVTSYEGLNARNLTPEQIGHPKIDCIVSDVSFISLKLALPPALALASPGSFCVLLVKPQFEAGRDAIGKGGLLRDPAQGIEIARDLERWLGTQADWRAIGFVPSPIAGGDGNQEYLLTGEKT